MAAGFPIRVRFAPSPTGQLHLGGLRTALFNWLFARHFDGSFLLRLEDTDKERSRQEYTDAILSAFSWVGIQSDEPMVIQSQRKTEHMRVIDHLVSMGKAYRCYCTQDQIVARHELTKPGEPHIKYDRFCRPRSITEQVIYPQASPEQPGPFVVRFALPEDRETVVFEDLICGHMSFETHQLDDFIIARSDGFPVYNFVVVVDDAFMNITHVIRAQEHLINTPKQILLYEACGYRIPQFAHVPLILGPDGDKLSKRDAATSVLDYKKEGFLPEALLNYLARLGWAHGDQEVFSKQELITYFLLDHVGKKGAIFDITKLLWLNGVYMRSKPAAELYDYALDCLDSLFTHILRDLHTDNHERLYALIELYKERVHTVKELMQVVIVAARGPEFYIQHDYANWITGDTKCYLEQVITRLQEQATFAVEDLKITIKDIANKHGLKLTQLAQPMRIALQGAGSGPGIFELLAILGKSESVKRIEKLRNHIQK